jgi:hypothetical protein
MSTLEPPANVSPPAPTCNELFMIITFVPYKVQWLTKLEYDAVNRLQYLGLNVCQEHVTILN